MLDDKIAEVTSDINNMVKIPLSGNEMDAVTSLIYNIGATNFRKSNALKLLNAGDKKGFIEEAFGKEKGFVRQDGKILAGLVDRRSKERALFTS